ncbi:hypothetical protein OAT67_06815 [Bacteriovoracaceae bacterium]|nr:hypothetical protein [Bacteriovoracaceae bacterium]
MMIQMTGHSSQEIKKLIRAPFFGAFFLISLLCLILSSCHQSKKPLKIAFIDTGFCPDLIETKKNITIHKTREFAGHNGLYCENFKKTNRRFHGHLVLENFLKHLKVKDQISVFPLVVFDNSGKQSAFAWRNALHFIQENNMDLMISASGLKINKGDSKSLALPEDLTVLVASGQRGIDINDKDNLFPQSDPSKQLLLIGSYFPPILKGDHHNLFKKTLLYQSKIDYYFPDSIGKRNLAGSSYAVSVAAAKALNLCLIELNDLKNCLSKHKKALSFANSPTQAFTY